MLHALSSAKHPWYIDGTGVISVLMRCSGTQALGVGNVTWEGFLILLGLQDEKILGIAFNYRFAIWFVSIFSSSKVSNPVFLGFTLGWVLTKKRCRPKPKSIEMFIAYFFD